MLGAQDGNLVDAESLKTALLKFKLLIEQGKTPARPPHQRTFAEIEANLDSNEVTTQSLFDHKAAPTMQPPSDDLMHSLETAFDGMLGKFKDGIAEGEWEKVQNFRGGFLERAKSMPQRRQAILDKLQRYRDGVQLMSGERPENNSAKADFVIEDLERLLP